MTILRWLDKHFEETLLCMLLVLISCIELLQVVARNLPFVSAITWAEEFCRICWIWSVFISIPYTLRSGRMLRVTALVDIMPEKIKHLIEILVDIITGFAMIWLAICSVEVVGSIRKSGESSPALCWPMWLIYCVMLFGFFCGFLRCFQQMMLHIRINNSISD